MKRLVALLLAACMIFALCACDGKGSDEGGTPTLRIYMPGSAQSDISSVVAEANKITQEKIGAKIDIQLIDSGAYNEKMNMIMASGEAYDVCFTGYVNKYTNAVSKGGLMCLDELLETTPTLKKQVPQYLWDAVTFEGSIYAVPNEQITATRTVMFTFKDLAEKYGLDTESITKYEQIEPYLADIKKGEPNMIPFRTNSGYFTMSDDADFRGFEEIINGVGIEIGDPKCKVVYVYDRPEYKAGVEKRNEWLKKGYIREDILSVGDDSMDYNNAKYAVWSDVWKPGVEESLTKKFNREVVSMSNVGTAYVKSASCLSTMLAIGRNSKNPEKSIKLIELLNTDKDFYNLICYGIEGKHYNLNEEGKVVKVDDSGWSTSSWMWGCQFNALVPEGTADTVWEETKKLNDEAEKSLLMNMVVDTSPITTEVANLASVIDEYTYVIQGLDVNYKNHEKAYRDKLSKVDLDKIIKELQKQVDACLAQNK